MSMQKKMWERLSLWSASASMVVALLAGIFVGFFDRSVEFGEIIITDPEEKIKIYSVSNLERQLENIQKQVSALTSIPDDLAVSAKLNDIDARLSQVANQVEVINKAIIQSPEKALEIPMLKRDVIALQEQYEMATRALEREISRAYDTIKWVLGTIVLGILGLAASVLLKGKVGEE